MFEALLILLLNGCLLRFVGKVLMEKILILQVSDVNDDVRRAAVTSIGFILFR